MKRPCLLYMMRLLAQLNVGNTLLHYIRELTEELIFNSARGDA